MKFLLRRHTLTKKQNTCTSVFIHIKTGIQHKVNPNHNKTNHDAKQPLPQKTNKQTNKQIHKAAKQMKVKSEARTVSPPHTSSCSHHFSSLYDGQIQRAQKDFTLFVFLNLTCLGVVSSMWYWDTFAEEEQGWRKWGGMRRDESIHIMSAKPKLVLSARLSALKGTSHLSDGRVQSGILK